MRRVACRGETKRVGAHGCTWAMSGAHEGCSQGKSVRDREGSKHSTAATPERVDSEAAVLPQDFEDTVHARQLKALCRRVERRMSRQGPGRSPSMGLTHLNAARPREKSSGVPHCGSSKILSDLVSHLDHHTAQSGMRKREGPVKSSQVIQNGGRLSDAFGAHRWRERSGGQISAQPAPLDRVPSPESVGASSPSSCS